MEVSEENFPEWEPLTDDRQSISASSVRCRRFSSTPVATFACWLDSTSPCTQHSRAGLRERESGAEYEDD